MSKAATAMLASIVLCFAAATAATAATAAAPAGDWEAGKQAFEREDFNSALRHFESARDAGLDTPAVHYNIAVSQYKAARYRESAKTFAIIGQRFPAMRGLAEYNLGLVSLRLGNETEARAHFLRAWELSPRDPEIRVLASRQLRELEDRAPVASRWRGAIGLRAGHDDNVALRDEAGVPLGTTTESPMADFFAVVQGPWDQRSGIRFDASVYAIKYFDADEFDQNEVRGAVFYDWRPNAWRLQFGAHAAAGTLGGDSFDRKVGVSALVAREVSANAVIDLRYTYDDVSDADAIFAGIKGDRQLLELRYRWYRDGHRVQLRYAHETNDRLDPAVSADRNRFSADYGFRPTRGFGYEAGIDFRNSEFDQLATPREEDLLTIWGAVTYAFTEQWTAMLDVRVADNDSTDPTFSYDRRQITLGFMRTF
jgi:hypothetical protein